MPLFVFAEMQITTQDEEIMVTVSPRNPEPYQDVTISLSSYATDLNKAIITWNMDSKIILSGTGKINYTFKASGPNSTNNFSIIIKPVGSANTITKKVSISPSEIDLLWESIGGYTPPFYKGKALPTRGGKIKMVAIPNTETITSGNGNISYSWKNNDNAEVDSSGYNKDYYVFKNDLFDSSNDITVTASSVEENYSAEKEMVIQTYSPRLIFYKRSPTEGILYNNALETESTLVEDEVTLVAIPYFLPLLGNENKFSYNWKINGEQIKTPSKKSELTVRPESRGGYANINLIIENAGELFQKVSNQLKLNI